MLSEPVLRTFVIVSIALVCAGIISVYAALNLSYFPAQAYVNPLFRYASIFTLLFLAIAFLESARSLKSQAKNKRYFAAQSFIDLTLVVLVISAVFAGTLEIETVKTVKLGNQTFTFSTLDYPVGNEFGHGATPLFSFDEQDKIHSVYFNWGESYGFENTFKSGQARAFYSGVHALESPNLRDVDFSGGEFSTRHGSVYVHEGNYVFEFFPTHGLSKEEDIRFLEFIKENISQIRADFRPHLGPSLRD